jgi:hypothetical protein
MSYRIESPTADRSMSYAGPPDGATITPAVREIFGSDRDHALGGYDPDRRRAVYLFPWSDEGAGVAAESIAADRTRARHNLSARAARAVLERGDLRPVPILESPAWTRVEVNRA